MFIKKYINSVRNIKSENNVLKITLLALIVIIVIEGVFILRAFNMQKVIIVPTVNSKYVISTNAANKPYLRAMASYLTGLTMNFTPLTIKKNYDDFLDYTAPQAFFPIQSGLYADIKPYQASDASSWFIVKSIETYPGSIVVKGIQRLLMSNKVVSDKDLSITIDYVIIHGQFQVTGYFQKKAKNI
jgi:conjugal transfer pilus assembly protein TraE